jgi:hypothetical protein
MIERAILSGLVAFVLIAAVLQAQPPAHMPIRGCVEQNVANKDTLMAIVIHDEAMARYLAERSAEAGRRCVW